MDNLTNTVKPKKLRKKIFLAFFIVAFYILLSLNPIIYKNKILCLNDELNVMNSNFDSYKVAVLCTTPQIMKGYQNSIEPTKNEGKLFVMGLPGRQGFWMKDVNFDLTLIYLDAKYRVLAINRLKANNQEIIWSPDNTAYALEVKAGFDNNFQIGEQLSIN